MGLWSIRTECEGSPRAPLSNATSPAQRSGALPVGSCHTPFFGYLILGLGFQNHKVGYPKKGVWDEPTGILRFLAYKLHAQQGEHPPDSLARALGTRVRLPCYFFFFCGSFLAPATLPLWLLGYCFKIFARRPNYVELLGHLEP